MFASHLHSGFLKCVSLVEKIKQQDTFIAKIYYNCVLVMLFFPEIVVTEVYLSKY